MSSNDPRFQHTRTIHDSQLPHIKWIELYGNGTAYECAVVQKDQFNQIWFIRVDQLDQVDKERLSRLVHDRRARQYTLAELMSQTTLANGENALKYFHQLVSVLMPSGEISRPAAGRLGLATTNLGSGNMSQIAGQVQLNTTSAGTTPAPTAKDDGNVVIA